MAVSFQANPRQLAPLGYSSTTCFGRELVGISGMGFTSRMSFLLPEALLGIQHSDFSHPFFFHSWIHGGSVQWALLPLRLLSGASAPISEYSIDTVVLLLSASDRNLQNITQVKVTD